MTPTVPTSSPAASAAIAQAGNAMLQGDAMAALTALRGVPAPEFHGEQARERCCLIDRFDREAPPDLPCATDDVFTRSLVAAYRAHWWHALREPKRRAALEGTLLDQVRQLLGLATPEAGSLEALAPVLAARLREAGCHALPPGRTAPLQELMLWRSEQRSQIDVNLPEGVQTVRLVLLDHFVERGWGHYARCGFASTAGWATSEGLFAVRPAYDDLDGEKFRVSLLVHEAQHFADYQHFPALTGWPLEYRAKLAELALAQATQATLLARFDAAQSDDTGPPHTHANRRVLLALSERLLQGLRDAGVPEIQAAARDALLADSAERKRGSNAASSA